MDSTLQYARDVLNGKFGKIKEMMEDIIDKKVGDWFRIVDSYLDELNITWDSLYTLTKREIKTLTINYDTLLWEKELKDRKILKYYKEGKGKLKYEFCYRNNVNSMFYARARLNSLGLEEARGRGKAHYNRICKLCGLEEEDLIHFMLKCPFLEKRRNYNIIDRSIIEPKERLIKCLFRQKEHQKTGKMIKEMWGIRRNRLKYEKKNKKANKNVTNYKKTTRSDPGPKRDGRDRLSLREEYWDNVGLIFKNNRGV